MDILLICGDGYRVSSEACDDGNTNSGDGYSSTCTIESKFTTRTETSMKEVEGWWLYGQGILYKDNGDKYTGIWDDNYDGQGEINYKDGKKDTGQWEIGT